MKLAILSHSEPLWWEKIGKVANWAQLAVPSHSEPLWWEKIGKVANRAKLAVPIHSEPLWWEKIGKANLAKLATSVGKEPKCHVDIKFHLNLKNRFTYSVHLTN